KKFNIVSDPPDWIEKETTTKAVPQQQIIDEINKQEEQPQTDQVDNTETGTDVNNGDTTNPTDPGNQDGQTTDPGNNNGSSTDPTNPTDPNNPPDQEQLPPGDNPVQQPSNTVQ
ncbi:MAG TPA: hypothetical protein VHQ70_06145, partial [Syntrophomonadaceae bacterium]|nr:hypothetical protein [Syntrophomonadaceae bacterium]